MFLSIFISSLLFCVLLLSIAHMNYSLSFKIRRWSGKIESLRSITVTAAIVIVCSMFTSYPSQADGGDFSLDFTAAAPFDYNHTTGGGAFEDRTVGKFDDIVESLEGGDFACGDTVTFLTQVVTASSPSDAIQTIELDYVFLANSTGQPGVALSDVTGVQINYAVASPDGDGLDSGNKDNDNSSATLTAELLTGPLYTSGAELHATVEVTNLEAGEEVIVRVDVRVSCDLGSRPTGNLQARLDDARTIAPNGDTIPGGAQTIPFKKVNKIEPAMIEVSKTVTTVNGNCPGNESLTIDLIDAVKYCYEVTNTATTTPLLNVMVVDDNGTPGNPNDDFEIENLIGLTNEDNDNITDDLAAGSVATGSAIVEINDFNLAGQALVNIATATADGVSDTDPAQVNINPLPVPAVEIIKEICIKVECTDGDFVDANSSTVAPITTLGGDATYRITVENIGETSLINVMVTDAQLNIVDYFVGNLAFEETKILTSVNIPELAQPGRCQISGDLTNIATVTAEFALTSETVMDSDPAVLRCVEEALTLIKEISIDGGTTYFDANDGANAPVVALGEGGLYRISVFNGGTADLMNVVLNDSTLGIANYAVGTVLVGNTVILGAGEIPALAQPERCEDPGDITNIATVTGTSTVTGNELSASDPAVLRCVEEVIEIVKEISVDGVNFFDANNSSTAPAVEIGAGATYRIILRNNGTTELINLIVNDAKLSISNFAVSGALAAGSSITLTSGDITQLDQSDTNLCSTADDFTNMASVTATSPATGNEVSDMDPAVLRCINEGITILKAVSVDGGNTFFDANTSDTAPSLAIGGEAIYRVTLENIGSSKLANLELNDEELEVIKLKLDDLDIGIKRTEDGIEISAPRTPCSMAGTHTNIASINAISVATGNTVSASDPALINCIGDAAGVLIIDEDSIDNDLVYWLGSVAKPEPNNGSDFSTAEINEHIPAIGQRLPLPFFVSNVGSQFQLKTGQVGDEAWYALQQVPSNWGGNGLRAFINGTLRQSKLDKIDDVTPLRATGLKGLEGGDYCAIVYDSDVSINYAPLQGNLQGEILGIAAFHVEIGGVRLLDTFSSSTLPSVLISALDPTTVCAGQLRLLSAPRPPSSSEPADIDPDNPKGGYLQ